MKQKVDKADLVRSRKESLEQHQNGVLRPMGKCFGLNAFVWKCPQRNELVAFLSGIPFKTVVLVPRVVVDALPDQQKSSVSHCQWLVYDDKNHELYGQVNTMKPAVNWIIRNEWQMEAFLFVADGVNADDLYLTFLKEWEEVK